MHKLSIVIATFNSAEFIISCLDSVFSQGSNDFETIVVDNGSIDDTVSKINRFYPQVTLIQNAENLGACKARNQGIERSRGEWILTLDCDVVLEKNFLERIIDFAQRHKKNIGIIQPKILGKDKNLIYSCGVNFSWLRRFRDIGHNKFDGEKFAKTRHIFGACSAAALYKKEMLEAVKEETGYFDERFFFLVEDVDLSWRAQKKGWDAVFFPQAVCRHSGNSSRVDEKIRQYLCFRNRYCMIIKNEGFFGYHKKLFPLFLYDLPRLFYLSLTNRHIRRAFLESAFR